MTPMHMPADASPALHKLLADFEGGRKAALARVVSMIEDGRAGSDLLLAAMHPRVGRARRIGLTGPPGAGKSTLTTGLAALQLGHSYIGIDLEQEFLDLTQARLLDAIPSLRERPALQVVK